MLKAVLIDDERPALRELEYLLNEVGGIEVVGSYTNPFDGIDAVTKELPNVVFIDINMPQLRGLDIAEMILDRQSGINIVFVTAYDQYAIDAFEMYALDYVLKPVSKKRLDKTVMRLKGKAGDAEMAAQKRLLITCLGKFKIYWEGSDPIRWRTEKTEELIAYLIHNRGHMLRKDEIIETLWPEADPEKAAHQLHNAVYYIRKTLEDAGISRELITIQSGYCLKLGEVELDVDLFNENVDWFKKKQSNEHLLKAEEAYTGIYFGQSGWSWADADREAFYQKYLLIADKLSALYIKDKDFVRAEEILLKAYAMNSFEERTTKRLLELYSVMKARSKAVKLYQEHEAILKNELGILPDESVRLKYREIIKN